MRPRLALPLLGPDPDAPFPAPESALREPDGLLAVGGDLHPTRLIQAYRQGIFPWYSDGQPILWWSPDPRMVFDTGAIHLSRRFCRSLRNSRWQMRADTAFDAVIAACAVIPRSGQDGTWITDGMLAAYRHLHRIGWAHSIEVFDEDRLVGGIYGVAVGRMFFGESMFSAESGASKAALAALARVLAGWGWPLLDAQVENPHLLSLGARRLPRAAFLQEVRRLTALPEPPGHWRDRVPPFAAASLAVPDSA